MRPPQCARGIAVATVAIRPRTSPGDEGILRGQERPSKPSTMRRHRMPAHGDKVTDNSEEKGNQAAHRSEHWLRGNKRY